MEDIKQQLLQERNKLVGTIGNFVNDTGREVGDEVDSSVEEQVKALNMLLKGHEKARLKKIEEALLRIEKGVYGLCLECDEVISKQRLEALPFAQTCVVCQQELERSKNSAFQTHRHG